LFLVTAAEARHTQMSANTPNSAADEVRRAFAGLSVEQKVSTLLRIELDMLGDAVEAVVAVASRAVDEAAAAFSECSKSNNKRAEGQPSPSGA
jgi:hypothetical protein